MDKPLFCLKINQLNLCISVRVWLWSQPGAACWRSKVQLSLTAHRGLLIASVITINSTKQASCGGTFRSQVLSESVVLDGQLTRTNTAAKARSETHPRQEELCKIIFPAKHQWLHTSIYLRYHQCGIMFLLFSFF